MNSNKYAAAPSSHMPLNLTKEQIVQKLYVAYFNRPADAAGAKAWLDALNNGASEAQIAEGFATSPEFIATYGNQSSLNYVTALYNNMFGHKPDGEGLVFWSAMLDSGKISRAQLPITMLNNLGYVDTRVVLNKLEAATSFTKLLFSSPNSVQAILAYQPTNTQLVEAVRAQLSAVRDDLLSLDIALTNLREMVSSLGQTLTPSNKNLVEVNSIYGNTLLGSGIAGGKTTSTGDDWIRIKKLYLAFGSEIHGRAGDDTLELIGTSSILSANLSGIENLVLTRAIDDNDFYSTHSSMSLEQYNSFTGTISAPGLRDCISIEPSFDTYGTVPSISFTARDGIEYYTCDSKADYKITGSKTGNFFSFFTGLNFRDTVTGGPSLNDKVEITVDSSALDDFDNITGVETISIFWRGENNKVSFQPGGAFAADTTKVKFTLHAMGTNQTMSLNLSNISNRGMDIQLDIFRKDSSYLITSATTIANLDKVHTISGLASNDKLDLPGDGERSYLVNLPSFNQASFASDVNAKLAQLPAYTPAANNLIQVSINGTEMYAVVDLTGNGISNDDGVIRLIGYDIVLNGGMVI